MAGEIIKVYNTEENARAGGTTGQVTVGTVSSNGGAVYNSTATVPYFIGKEYWYRFEANTIIQGIHIDWDDGEDNSLENDYTINDELSDFKMNNDSIDVQNKINPGFHDVDENLIKSEDL